MTTHMLAPRALCLSMAGTLLGSLFIACQPPSYDPRVFDDLVDSTWVHSTTSPKELSALRYGIALGGGSMGTDGARFFAAARQQDGFVHLHYAPDGSLQTTVLPLVGMNGINTLTEPNPLASRPLMVTDPSSGGVAVALTNGGTADAPGQTTIALLDTATGRASALLPLPGPELATGMAIGVTNVHGASTTNIVTARGNLISIIGDILMPAVIEVVSCTQDRTATLGMTVAELDNVAAESEIVFAATDEFGAAELVVMEGRVVAEASDLADPEATASCFDAAAMRAELARVPAPGSEKDFGHSIVAAHINDNPATDLVVTAPSSGTIYVYFDLDDVAAGGLPQPLVVSAPAGAADFAQAVAVGDISGNGRDELIVSAPGTTVDEAAAAGAVYVYALDDTGMLSEPVVLSDAQAEENQRYGQAVAMVPFGSTRSILVVGSDNEVYTYFRTPISDDVR